MQNFVTHDFVKGQPVCRELITGQEFPYKTGTDTTTATPEQLLTITTRGEAEQAAITAQRTLVAAMLASGDLAASVDDLQGLRAAYAVYSA